jgi:hypothetical protein
MCGTYLLIYGVSLLESKHLDAGTVAAFCARTLHAQERYHVFEHLATCEACREWVLINAQLTEPQKDRRPMANESLCGLLAAGIAMALFAWWSITAPSPRELPVNLSRSTPGTLALIDWDAPTVGSRLPPPWRQVRLAPDLFPPAPDRALRGRVISLQTTMGERRIATDRVWGSVVP